ncbi:MAG TPA: amidohydrolase family protein [Terriglobia bacterium]|nr:amidohydrolase family protein [Terriglobia bacterium]
MNRRGWLWRTATGVLAGGLQSFRVRAATAAATPLDPVEGCPLALKDYRPQSMLHVSETLVPRSRFPVIDAHTHLSSVAEHKKGVAFGEKMRFLVEPEDALAVMDRKNIRIMVDLTGGVGAGLKSVIRKYHDAYPGRFVVFTEPWWERAHQPGYSKFQADQIERAHRAGAAGLKVLKTMGLYLREEVTSGPLVKVDDHRFDAMWEACGGLEMPVAIHTSDPEAFFFPIDPTNERYEELSAHPDWSFYGKDFPSNRELLEARNRVFARHPQTQFIALHVGGDAENLAAVSEWLDRYPNMHVDLAARIGELGRQPRAARAFFEKYQDRILFGTDATPGGVQTPQQLFTEKLYEIYFRFLETTDEYFDYAPAPVPPQGRWKIYGLGLPEAILRKVYYENAARLLKLTC